MQFISDFADLALTLPLVVIVWAVISLLGGARLISKWAACVALVWTAILILKALSFEMTVGDPDGMASPSGHTASAAIVYGGLAWLLLRHHAPKMAIMVVAVITALVGVSRVALLAHSVPEVLVGGAVGVAGLLTLVRWAEPALPVRVKPMLLVGVIVIPLLHGATLPVEHVLQTLVLGP